MSDCIFCKIANGEIGSLVYETDTIAAFDDAHPQAPVHVLVVPKKHYKDITDGIPREIAADLIEAIDEVAKIKGIDKSGFRVINNCGEGAGQSVFHVHLHVLGGQEFEESSL